MKTTTSQKAKIGIFTLVGLTVLVIGIFVIGDKKNMFGDTFSIYGTFKNVGGLQEGNNVRFAGINVGTVESISIVNDTTVRVTMRMESKVHEFLKTDAVASIGSDGLMGDKLITIAPGINGDEIKRNGQIMTVNPVDFDKIITKITHVADNAEIITASLAGIASQIGAGRGSLGKLIFTDSLERGLVGTVNAAKQTMISAKAGVAGFDENMTAVRHNFLLKGYFKKKAREKAEKEQQKADSVNGGNGHPDESKRQRRRDAREERKEQKKDAEQTAPAPNAK